MDMSGEIKLVSGYVFDEAGGEVITLEKLNKIIGDAVASVMAGAITATELADGSINADKLAAEISAQLGIPAGSITTAKLVDLAVTAAKLAADAVETDKIKDGAVTAAKIAADAITTAAVKDGEITAAKLNADVKMIPTAANAYAFSAYRSAAVNITNSWAKITLDVETFDYGSCFAGGKFTAPVNGLYFFSGCVNTAASDKPVQAALAKNGTRVKHGTKGADGDGATSTRASHVSGLLALAAGDYVELWATVDATSTVADTGATKIWMDGHIVATL